jgi:hypothetical protein
MDTKRIKYEENICKTRELFREDTHENAEIKDFSQKIRLKNKISKEDDEPSANKIHEIRHSLDVAPLLLIHNH